MWSTIKTFLATRLEPKTRGLRCWRRQSNIAVLGAQALQLRTELLSLSLLAMTLHKGWEQGAVTNGFSVAFYKTRVLSSDFIKVDVQDVA